MRNLFALAILSSLGVSFPDLVVSSTETNGTTCTISMRPQLFTDLLEPGTYIFRDLLQLPNLQLLTFDFRFKEVGSCREKPVFFLRDRVASKASSRAYDPHRLRLIGHIFRPDHTMKEQLILSIPTSRCLYELQQASIILEFPESQRNQICPVGWRLNIDEEYPTRVPPEDGQAEALEMQDPTVNVIEDEDLVFRRPDPEPQGPEILGLLGAKMIDSPDYY